MPALNNTQIMKTLFFAIILSLLTACASTGTQVSQASATQFIEGTTTEAEIVQKLGPPTSVTIGTGTRTIGYTGAQYRTKAATFIPIVGLFAGGADMQVTTAAYEIKPNGVLSKITYTSSNTGSQSGFLPTSVEAPAPTAK